MSETIVSPNPPTPPPSIPQPSITPEVARPAAVATLSSVGVSLDTAHAQVASAQVVAASWTDEFWTVSGYDKTATLAALDSLLKLSGAYTGANGLAGIYDYSADAAVLKEQAPA